MGYPPWCIPPQRLSLHKAGFHHRSNTLSYSSTNRKDWLVDCWSSVSTQLARSEAGRGSEAAYVPGAVRGCKREIANPSFLAIRLSSIGAICTQTRC